ncbi:hypothetical protein D3C84_607120 [compost metagenome]
MKGGNQADLFFVGLSEVAGQQALAPVIVLTQGLVITTVGSPATAGRGEQRLVVALETQGQLLWREVLQRAANGGAAGGQQRHLMRLQIAECTGDRLFGRQLARLVRLQQNVQCVTSIDGEFQRVLLRALHGGLGQTQFVFQFAAGAQALLQTADALLEQACSVQRQGFAGVVVEAFEVHAQRCTEVLPETFALALRRFCDRAWCGFGGGVDQLRHHQAFHVDTRIVGALTGVLDRGARGDQLFDFRVHALLLIKGVQRIEIKERVIRDDAARRLWATDFNVEGRRVAHQPRTDLEITQHVGAAMFDAHRFALAQACAAAAILDTVAAGVGQEERPFAKADVHMVIGQMTLAVRDDPVAILAPANHAAGLLEGLLAQLRGHELLGVQHFENQFHGDTPCGHLPRLTACGSPNGR